MLAAGSCLKGLGQGRGVGGRHEETGVDARNLRHAGVRAGHDGRPVRHGLEDGQAEALPDRGEGEDSGTRIRAGQVGVVESAEDVHAPGGKRRVGGVASPSGGPHEDEVEVGAL
ncbi:Uncharacterised protein [Mycobacteroides abscessus subsp. abscessus]|nr:Uncharacterised protein [Mycobacteroides abscessus subsp. abscessus]